MDKVLTKAETRYQATELEMSCLVWTSKKVRISPQSNKAPIMALTDHRALVSTVNQKSLRPVNIWFNQQMNIIL